MQPLTLLVLAAGMGSRYGGLKQMDPIGPGGEAIVDYSVYDAVRAGFSRVVFVVRRSMAEDFRSLVSRRFESAIEVVFAYQELDELPAPFEAPQGRTKPWGTAHAILCARAVIDGPFVVINADDFYGKESFELLARFLATDSHHYAMAGFSLRNTLSEFGPVARGICRVSSEGYLDEIVERTGIERDGAGARDSGAGMLTGDETVSMNMWAFTPAVFDAVATQFQLFLEKYGRTLDRECYLPSVVNALIHASEGDGAAAVRVKVLPTQASWFGVTYREDRPRVSEGIRALIAEGRYPAELWSTLR